MNTREEQREGREGLTTLAYGFSPSWARFITSGSVTGREHHGIRVWPNTIVHFTAARDGDGWGSRFPIFVHPGSQPTDGAVYIQPQDSRYVSVLSEVPFTDTLKKCFTNLSGAST